MRNRILEIAEQPARLRIERHQLIVESGEASTSIPVEDLAVLVVSHPQVSYTQAVLNELMSNGGAFLTCDERRMPSGLLLPLDGNVVQTKRFHLQLEVSQPRRKQLWKQLIRAKIVMQSILLHERFGTDHGLSKLVSSVRSGDTENVEGQAARRYWRVLFGSDFRRDRNAPDHNRLLNYGYAVLRASVSRAIVAAGLHQTIGLHHHNQYNSFCLADDVMEPYRPLIDRAVATLVDDHEGVPEINKEVRHQLLAALTGNLIIGGESRTLFDSLARTASSLVQALAGECDLLELPTGFSDPTSSD